MEKSKFTLLRELQNHDCFIVYRHVELETGEGKAWMQKSTYDKVDLHWNGSVLKFWCNRHEGTEMFIKSNIKDYTWNNTTVEIYIVGCSEPVCIECDTYSNV